MVVLNLIFFLPVTANCFNLLQFVGRCYYLSSGSTICTIFLEGRYLILLGLTKSVHPSTLVMLTVLIICIAGMYIWTLSFLDCCSSLSFSCTYLLNLPWSENTPSKHDLCVACRGLEGCFRVLNKGVHGLSSPLSKILTSPGPLL